MRLSAEEVILLGEMLLAVDGKVSLDSSDAWSSNLDTSEVYSVKSAYAHLSRGLLKGASLIIIWSMFYPGCGSLKLLTRWLLLLGNFSKIGYLTALIFLGEVS